MGALRPLVVLAPGRSFTTVVTAMLGQHPELYGFPETYLLTTRTIAEWSVVFGPTVYSHGLLRSVGELITGGQTEAAIERAQEWLQRRLDWPTDAVFAELAHRVVPRRPIYKDPFMVRSVAMMRRVQDALPAARYLHLTRHPIEYGRSVLKFQDELRIGLRGDDGTKEPRRQEIRPEPVIDPQRRWYRLHANILDFLDNISPCDQRRVRGEDLLADPDTVLTGLAEWLDIRPDADALSRMQRPECWPFAKLGPANARFGGDPSFFRAPALRPGKPSEPSLDAPMPWSLLGARIGLRVRLMAEQFGYV